MFPAAQVAAFRRRASGEHCDAEKFAARRAQAIAGSRLSALRLWREGCSFVPQQLRKLLVVLVMRELPRYDETASEFLLHAPTAIE
jgi:hypothetical protein